MTKPSMQRAREHADWYSNWQQVFYSHDISFNLWCHGGFIRIRCYAGERYLPKCIIERHSGETPRFMV